MKKNPYELRFDIYQAAESRLQQQYVDELDDFRRTVEVIHDSRDDVGATTTSFGPDNRPKFPSLEEVFEEAQKIKSFVENKDS